jgi:hypothetical protein
MRDLATISSTEPVSLEQQGNTTPIALDAQLPCSDICQSAQRSQPRSSSCQQRKLNLCKEPAKGAPGSEIVGDLENVSEVS